MRMNGYAELAVRGRLPGSGKLVAFIEELLWQDPDITLFELRDALAEARVWKPTTRRLPAIAAGPRGWSSSMASLCPPLVR